MYFLLEWILVWWYGNWRTPITEEAANKARRALNERNRRARMGAQVCGAGWCVCCVLTTMQTRDPAPVVEAGEVQPQETDPETGEPIPYLYSPYDIKYAVVKPLWADGTPRPLEENDFGFFQQTCFKWEWWKPTAIARVCFFVIACITGLTAPSAQKDCRRSRVQA